MKIFFLNRNYGNRPLVIVGWHTILLTEIVSLVFVRKIQSG